jgi:hypothetical protein
MILALEEATLLPGRLQRWQQQSHQDSDDGHYHEQFDERKSAGSNEGSLTPELSILLRKRHGRFALFGQDATARVSLARRVSMSDHTADQDSKPQSSDRRVDFDRVRGSQLHR